ncbi:putative glucose-specific phosphotransferase enzyme IIA component [Gemella bergeri ATCC 700627]|uniref:Putative glucose-specific phosphotransferase enzyme IIA component n=2 Tax=Gemella bergeri TaxID=84136 RepID=U2QIQ8_9BACL|nr:putative glucose-specific phosphotransferase enzyme IIA component [Gemella bergeri ATCC 700627]
MIKIIEKSYIKVYNRYIRVIFLVWRIEMGFLSKLLGKEDKKIEELVINSYMKGKVVAITEVPDPVFSQKMMGDGFAIIPEEGKLLSPVSGEIIQVFPTKHAFGIKTGDVELLIHVGLETVAMKGEGFDVLVSAGDKVEVGQALLTYDLELVKEKAKDIITPCVVTNMDIVEDISVLKLNETVDFSQEVAKIKLK